MNILQNPFFFRFVIVSSVFILLYFLFLTLMRRVERRKLSQLEKRKTLESMVTESPVDENYEDALQRGLENIHTRFGFFKKALLPFLSAAFLFFLFLPQLGAASKTYTSIIIAVITVFLSIASKPIVENLFAGLVISFSDIARIGDTVEIDGHYGTIEEINLTFTTIKKWDWRRYLVPNSRLLAKEFINYSLHDKFVWACIEYFIEPEADTDAINKELVERIKKSQFFNNRNFEDPQIWNMGMEKETVRYWAAAWAKNPSEGWNLKSDMRNAILKIMKEHKVRPHLSHHNVSPYGPGK